MFSCPSWKPEGKWKNLIKPEIQNLKITEIQQANLSYTVKNITIQKSRVCSRIRIWFDWGTFLALVSLALVSVQGNWDDYVSQRTSISVDQEAMPGHPVMSFCMAFVYDPNNLGPPKPYVIGTEIKITLLGNSYRFV